MTVLIKPTFGCNFDCGYCYEASLRRVDKARAAGWDVAAIKVAMERVVKQSGRKDLVFHGGEFTLLPKLEAEDLFRHAFELTGHSAIQTNGYLLDEGWIELFARWKVSLGVSIDGPTWLNGARGFGDAEMRREQTEKVMANIGSLRKAGVNVGVISVIRKQHMPSLARERFKNWVLELAEMGVSGRMNPVFCTDPALIAEYQPDWKEAGEWYAEMADFVFSKPNLAWQPFRDVVDNLLGLGTGTCVFTQCDLYTSEAAYVIGGGGTEASCCRSTASGINFVRGLSSAPLASARTTILEETPFEMEGCAGCRWWRICYGYCAGGGIGGDWRNRADCCEAMKGLYVHVYDRLKGLMPNLVLVPDQEGPDDYLMRHSNRQAGRALAALIGPCNPSTWKAEAVAAVRCGGVGDGGEGAGNSGQGGTAHGDIPHGDSMRHLDHSDIANHEKRRGQ